MAGFGVKGLQPDERCVCMQVPLEELLDDLAAMHIEEDEEEDGEQDAAEGAAGSGAQQQPGRQQQQQQQLHGQPPGVNGLQR